MIPPSRFWDILQEVSDSHRWTTTCPTRPAPAPLSLKSRLGGWGSWGVCTRPRAPSQHSWWCDSCRSAFPLPTRLHRCTQTGHMLERCYRRPWLVRCKQMVPDLDKWAWNLKTPKWITVNVLSFLVEVMELPVFKLCPASWAHPRALGHSCDMRPLWRCGQLLRVRRSVAGPLLGGRELSSD